MGSTHPEAPAPGRYRGQLSRADGWHATQRGITIKGESAGEAKIEVGPVGLEPTTRGLKVRCSTD